MYEDLSAHLTMRFWNQWIGSLAPRWEIVEEWRTVRELPSGDLLFRCDKPTLNGSCTEGWVIGKESKLVTKDGLIFDTHPKVRWSLIALLQTILAAPLVGLWGLLRWRKWRRARAAP
jgi:hypothetical protein